MIDPFANAAFSVHILVQVHRDELHRDELHREELHREEFHRVCTQEQ